MIAEDWGSVATRDGGAVVALCPLPAGCRFSPRESDWVVNVERDIFMPRLEDDASARVAKERQVRLIALSESAQLQQKQTTHTGTCCRRGEVSSSVPQGYDSTPSSNRPFQYTQSGSQNAPQEQESHLTHPFAAQILHIKAALHGLCQNGPLQALRVRVLRSHRLPRSRARTPYLAQLQYQKVN